jgi:hypothetical protein
MKSSFFGDVMPYSPLKVNQHFGRTCHLHPHGQRIIIDLETNSRIKNIWDLYRGINEFKKGFQLRTYLVKGDSGHQLSDTNSILNKWKNYFCQVLNIYVISTL